MAATIALRVVVVCMAVCGLAAAQDSYGTVYGDIGVEAPYVQSLSPPEGPKQGGTMITIQGAGFRDDTRSQCRFSRLNPNTEMTVTKTQSATYVSPTEIRCEAPDWEEDDCPTCVSNTALSGRFFGHTGSPYLRSDSVLNTKEIGVGDYIQLAAATVGLSALKKNLVQYYQVKAIETCEAIGTPTYKGCFCDGDWIEDRYDVQMSYNGTGTPTSAANSGFEVVTANTTNCALYKYDVYTHGAGDSNSALPRSQWPAAGGAECQGGGPFCSGAWAAGTKLTLSEPVFKINGRANVMFENKVAKRASKFSCTSCKCQEGCTVTVTVSNDGKKFSGNGLGGQLWAGTGAMFSLKDIVPTVQYIDHGLPGYRDSTRIFGPASGGTTITITGENFQDSPLLRCYFAGVFTMAKAEWLSSTKVRCKTPDFFSRQLDGSMETSNQDGSAKNPHTKVMVTNDGMLNIMETEGDATGHISQNPHLNDDGSKSYIWTFNHDNTYNSGMSGSDLPFRSTCQSGLYPNEGMSPCWDAHSNEVTSPGVCTGEKVERNCPANYGIDPLHVSAGNDVLFKYATCYDANPAGAVPSLNLYTGTTVGSKAINSTSTLGQEITIAGHHDANSNGIIDTDERGDELHQGPLVHLELHLEKISSAGATLEVSVCSGSFCAHSGSLISKETVTVSEIKPPQVDYKYNVFFKKPAYLLAGTKYYVQIKWIEGAEDVVWKYTDNAQTGYYAHLNYPVGFQFKLKGYSCDGCREKYVFDPAAPVDSTRFGTWNGTQDTGSTTVDQDVLYSDSRSTMRHIGTYRSMAAQEFRPSESGTLTHVNLKLQNVPENGVAQSYVSMWITQHGKYGEYVCSTFGGLLEPGYQGNTLASASSSAGGASQANNQPAMGASLNVCDSDFDGNFDNACGLGTVCDPNLALNGGCGYYGKCELAETVQHGHRLRPESGGQQGPCGVSEDCAATMTLLPDHQKTVKDLSAPTWVEFEFTFPVAIEKHTTYFINTAVVGNPDISKEVIWFSGKHYGDGGANKRANVILSGADSNPISDELRSSFTRSPIDWRWEKNTELVLATKLTRCVSSTAQVLDFVTTGAKTGCCSARASPQGGDKGAMVYITGRNFFPSDDLRCIFRHEDGSTGAVVPGEPTDASYTTMKCRAPTMHPHKNRDCTNPSLCQGTVLVVTNDLYTVGPQYMGPKWFEPTTTKAQPAYLGLNPLKFLFDDIWISPSGSDMVGDGTIARPYATIQKGLDAANENDQLILLPGYYTGLGNRGLRHHGKKIQLKSYEGDRQNTVIDCQHAPDGFILNNNKDSESPFAGYVDTQDILTKNCENLRIYDI